MDTKKSESRTKKSKSWSTTTKKKRKREKKKSQLIGYRVFESHPSFYQFSIAGKDDIENHKIDDLYEVSNDSSRD